MFRQAENKVKIEGILSEIDLKYGSFERKTDGATVETIGGVIRVLVDQVINGEESHLEVPVHLFSTKYTKTGKINPSYESIETVMKEFKSIAATGDKSTADKIRITSGAIKMNEFVGQNGSIVSTPRVTASFVAHAIGEFKPQATFTLEFMVSKFNRVVDKDGVEVDPAKLAVEVIVPQYTAENAPAMNVDVVPLYATSNGVIDAVEQYWEAGQCFRANGRLNFTSRTETVKQEVDFGEAQESVRTINISEFVITGGSQSPLDGDAAWELDDIKAGMAARKERLEKLKSGEKSTTKKTPAQNSSKDKNDLGF
jgi:hypothetical protein